MLSHAYLPAVVKSNTETVPSCSINELPSLLSMFPLSFGDPTKTVLSITHRPLPKSSIDDTLSVTNLSSITYFVLYKVAV